MREKSRSETVADWVPRRLPLDKLPKERFEDYPQLVQAYLFNNFGIVNCGHFSILNSIYIYILYTLQKSLMYIVMIGKELEKIMESVWIIYPNTRV